MLSISIFLCCFWGCFSQDYDYISYTTKDGLPTNYVYGVIEDNEGSIWAYTENGMSKFDGYTFQNFSTKDGLPGNDIVNAIKDKEGKIFLWAYNNQPSYLYQDSFHIIHDVQWNNITIHLLVRTPYTFILPQKWFPSEYLKMVT